MHFNWPSVYFTAGAQNLEAQSGAPNSMLGIIAAK